MHTVLDDGARALLSVSRDELEAIRRAVDAAARAPGVADADFAARFAVSRQGMEALHAALCATPHAARQVHELVDAWDDQGVVMMRVMNTYGDPVEFGEDEATEFLSTLERVVREAP